MPKQKPDNALSHEEQLRRFKKAAKEHGLVGKEEEIEEKIRNIIDSTNSECASTK